MSSLHLLSPRFHLTVVVSRSVLIAQRVESYPVSRAMKAKIHWYLGT
jgi:hypothetical protein